eukprot:5585228-Prymnesium_polylepis.1
MILALSAPLSTSDTLFLTAASVVHGARWGDFDSTSASPPPSPAVGFRGLLAVRRARRADGRTGETETGQIPAASPRWFARLR